MGALSDGWAELNGMSRIKLGRIELGFVLLSKGFTPKIIGKDDGPSSLAAAFGKHRTPIRIWYVMA